jgi:aspartate-semialdehyde dehydrogenase
MEEQLKHLKQPYELLRVGSQDKPVESDIAILCTDDEISFKLAQVLKDKTKFIVDMSAKFRNEPGIPLVIPEINPHAITKETQLISSPNCTTTGLVMALNPLKKKYTLEEVFFSSYQAISGGGKKLLEDFKNPESLYRANCVPLIGSIKENLWTSEELKGLNETRKILELPKIKVRCHCVRVPVEVSHSLCVSLRAKEAFDLKELPSLFATQKGLVYDEKIHTPKEVVGQEEVFVSRLRLDPEDKNYIHFWITFDNLLKGAALNGRQIVAYLMEKFL